MDENINYDLVDGALKVSEQTTREKVYTAEEIEEGYTKAEELEATAVAQKAKWAALRTKREELLAANQVEENPA